jgi:hypothetical protein
MLITDNQTDTNLLFFSTIFSIDSTKIKKDKLCIQNQQQAYDYLGKLVRIPNFDKKQQAQVKAGQFEIVRKGLFRQKTVMLNPAILPTALPNTYCIFDIHNDANVVPDYVSIAGNNRIEVIAQNSNPVCSSFNTKLLVKILFFDKDLPIFILSHFAKFSILLKLDFANCEVQYLRLNKRSNATDPYVAYEEYIKQEKESKLMEPLNKSLTELINYK